MLLKCAPVRVFLFLCMVLQVHPPSQVAAISLLDRSEEVGKKCVFLYVLSLICKNSHFEACVLLYSIPYCLCICVCVCEVIWASRGSESIYSVESSKLKGEILGVGQTPGQNHHSEQETLSANGRVTEWERKLQSLIFSVITGKLVPGEDYSRFFPFT